jgi:DNA-directed RNA polymerase specialized sigma24 family protein
VGEERICPRDADELAACFAAHAAGLFGYACVLARGDRALADDLVQAAFEAAAREWESCGAWQKSGAGAGFGRRSPISR